MTNFETATVWSGNTFSIKGQLADLGGVWDAAAKVWRLPRLVRGDAVRATRLALTRGVEVEPEVAHAV